MLTYYNYLNTCSVQSTDPYIIFWIARHSNNWQITHENKLNATGGNQRINIVARQTSHTVLWEIANSWRHLPDSDWMVIESIPTKNVEKELFNQEWKLSVGFSINSITLLSLWSLEALVNFFSASRFLSIQRKADLLRK